MSGRPRRARRPDATDRGRVADVTLKIPRPLYERLAQVIEGTGFRSVTEFCVFVLRDLVAAQGQVEGELRPEDIAVVRERRHTLGYLER